jgi:hypothetical protein
MHGLTSEINSFGIGELTMTTSQKEYEIASDFRRKAQAALADAENERATIQSKLDTIDVSEVPQWAQRAAVLEFEIQGYKHMCARSKQIQEEFQRQRAHQVN